ncbi:hypothetical protein GMD78_04070 [Ornithinibacillus sp. L9]|uniref:GyrI-like small molecule binding domain-containing protein n=1 Tax=Ornithinibacillus caprae TaxID=2678566 RepID=A0A6N8FHP4_9BACI|nr:hypothetical protein [Ornithinibacillus caprae]MUK87577.1 hypothetical protein [Ornithinibacillus caprae]
MDQMMLVADCTTEEMFLRALKKMKKNLRVQDLPTISFVERSPSLCAQRLYVGHYQNTKEVFEEMKKELTDQGYRTLGPRRDIYLLPAMDCYPAEKSKTIISVDVEKK